ncbi:MAG: SDR family NAD(P)-dependent oxidoreductase, partial [Chitinivibrionales bacterium]|nr:SDR family NAD(P)-dependent oxidoreductase [Chitinivibrionales bacterium]
MILITGASGNVGGEVIRLFEQHGERCIAAGRSNRWQNNAIIDYRYFDLDQPESYDAAKGVGAVFLVRPPQVSNIKKTVAPFLRKCKEFGVKKVVFLSIVGAPKVPFIPHHAIEKEIERLGFSHTFLRAGFFMQNLSTTH